jgi:hypothetical protein
MVERVTTATVEIRKHRYIIPGLNAMGLGEGFANPDYSCATFAKVVAPKQEEARL